jgi:exodeoxyribonuclease V alpha subunit
MSTPATQIDLLEPLDAPMTQATNDPAIATLATLHGWSDKGWLRRLDSALASFMLELDATAEPALLVSTAVLAQMEGRGHTCLPLRLLVAQPEEVLAWPPQAQAELQAFWSSLPSSLDEWLNDLRASPLVRNDGQSADLGQPLVLSQAGSEPLLYLRRYRLHEQQVAQQIRQRCASSQTVDEPLAAQWLDRLFENANKSGEAGGTVNWQKLACAVALRASLTVITGGPGTGKTYTAARLLALLFAMSTEPTRLRVALAAPTGKAAARLRQSIDFSLQELGGRLGTALDLPALTQRMGAAKTLHSLLGARLETREFRFNASNLLDVDILIVDEASMIHLEMMSALLQALPADAKLILLGDKDQLASVEAGAVLGDMCRDAVQGRYSAETARYVKAASGQTVPRELLAAGASPSALTQQTVMLRHGHRFGGVIGELALAVNGNQSSMAQSLLQNDVSGVLQTSKQPTVDSVLQLAVQGVSGATASYADYLQRVNAGTGPKPATPAEHEAWVKAVLKAFDHFRILCAVHESDWGTRALNQSVQRALEQAGLLKPRGEWFAGRPVMVTRNDPALGVFNGDVGVTLPGPPGTTALRVYFLDGDKLRSVGVSRLAHVETAFAMTVHKSQGSEFLHTALVLPPGGSKVLTRELVYTGITRARERFTLIEAQEGLLRMAIERKSQRASGLEYQLRNFHD